MSAFNFRRKRDWHKEWSREGKTLRHTSGLRFDVLCDDRPVALIQVHSLLNYLLRETDEGRDFLEISPEYDRLVRDAQVWVDRNWSGRWNPRTKSAHQSAALNPQPQPA